MLVTYTHLVEHNENPKINITADMYIQPFSAAHQHSYPPWAGSQIELRIWKVVSPVKFPTPTNLTAVSSYFYPRPPWDPSQASCPSQILVNRRKISIPQILASLFILEKPTASANYTTIIVGTATTLPSSPCPVTTALTRVCGTSSLEPRNLAFNM
jgi:hypothetical protein